MEPSRLVKHLANTVSTAIKDAGRTQLSIAETTGIAMTTLERRLAANPKPFIFSELVVIAAELNTAVSTLVLAAEASEA